MINEYQTYLIQIIGGITAIFCFVLAYVIARKGPRFSYVRTFVLYSCFVGLWILTVFFSDISTNLSELVQWTKLACIFALGFVMSFGLFAHQWRDNPIHGWRLALFLLPGIILVPIVLLYDPAKIYNPDPFVNFAYQGPVGGILNPDYYYFVLVFFLYYCYGLWVLVKQFKSLAFEQRNKVQYIVLGAGSSIGLALIFNGVLPLFGLDYLYSLGAAVFLLMVILTSYAIYKHRLFDIRIAAQKGLIYSVVLGLLILAYWLLLNIIGVVIEHRNSTAFILSGMLTAIAGSFGVPLLERLFRKLTDRWFFKNPYDYANALRQLSASLNNSLNLEDLLVAANKELKQIFKLSYVGIIIKEQMLLFQDGHYSEFRYPQVAKDIFEIIETSDSYVSTPVLELELVSRAGNVLERLQTLAQFRGLVKEHELELWVRISTPEKLIGFLALGAKKSGDSFTYTDEQMLETFSHQAAVAIEKSLLYERLKHRAEELDEAVQVRTAELNQFHENQSRMMTDVAHALQSPLTVMKTEIHAAQRGSSGDYKFEVLEKSIDDVSKHIYDLLRLGRMEIQTDVFEFQPVNLSKLVEEIVEYVSVICVEAGIKLNHSIAPNVIVRGDPQKLEELINNLVSNAIKYIANARVINLELSVSSHEKGFVELTVRDTGIGISPEALPYIFKRFYRANGDKGVSGMGIGLAICKYIVERHTGKITVESKLGEGTIFQVSLPL